MDGNHLEPSDGVLKATACKHCYAKRMSAHLKAIGMEKTETHVRELDK